MGSSSIAGIDAALTAGFAVTGVVMSSTGVPISNAWVSVVDNAGMGGHVTSTRTDAGGRYTLHLLDGSYQINFNAPAASCCSDAAYLLNVVVAGRDQTVNGRLP